MSQQLNRIGALLSVLLVIAATAAMGTPRSNFGAPGVHGMTPHEHAAPGADIGPASLAAKPSAKAPGMAGACCACTALIVPLLPVPSQLRRERLAELARSAAGSRAVPPGAPPPRS